MTPDTSPPIPEPGEERAFTVLRQIRMLANEGLGEPGPAHSLLRAIRDLASGAIADLKREGGLD